MRADQPDSAIGNAGPRASFREQLRDSVQRNVGNAFADNLDYLRFPWLASWSWRMRRGAWRIVTRLLPTHLALLATGDQARMRITLETVDALTPALAAAYARLADDKSRELMVELFAFRVLGPTRFRLSTNSAAYQAALHTLAGLPTGRVDVPKSLSENLRGLSRFFGALGEEWDCPPLLGGFRIGSKSFIGPLAEFDLRPLGHELSLAAHPAGILTIFLLQQYAFCRGGRRVAVEPGDAVIDCGACWGDATLYFAQRVGEPGHVWGFEFSPDNLGLLEQNIARNPRLAARIAIDRRPLWSKSGQTLRFKPNGPGTQVSAQGGPGSVESLTIDDFVRERGLERVDFIKMDIEGSELAALQGASETLRRFRPKLALAAYHTITDIPDFISQIDRLHLGYRFYLDHFTIHQEETMLFATAR